MNRPQPPKPQSFTYTAKGLALVLQTPVHVGLPIKTTKASGVSMPAKPNAQAIWDTGATITVVTKGVADRLGLRPVGMIKCKTVGGERESNIYVISLFLPNGVCIPEMKVCEGEVDGGDMLVGMDIIVSGDLAVSNFQGKTTISYRWPSAARIDFQRGMSGGSLNRLCECGSGKKYKHCCGKG